MPFTKEYEAILRKRLLTGESPEDIAEEEEVSIAVIEKLVNSNAVKPQNITFTSSDIVAGTSYTDLKEIRLVDGKILTTTSVSGGKNEIAYGRWKNKMDVGKNNTYSIIGIRDFKFNNKANYDLFRNYLLDWKYYKSQE